MEVLAPSIFLQETPPAAAPTTAPGATPTTQGAAGDGTTGTTQPGGTTTEGGQPAAGPLGPIMSLLPFLMIIVIFYFVMIGPERKNRKKREAMLAAVKKGDKVLTTGGMFATVAAVNEDSITLQVSDDVRLRFSRAAIAQVIEDEVAGASAKS